MSDLLAPRLASAFANPRATHAALIPYVTGGFPNLATSHRVIDAFVAAGADIVELGVPFSDPIADGPVVQRSSHEALLAGTTPDHILDLAATHSSDVPIVLLTYVNSVLSYGPERFFARCATAGVEALVIPDLPLDESPAIAATAASCGVSIVPMATPTSTAARFDLIARTVTSFVYCVSVTGVTGARGVVAAELPDLLARLRAHTPAPLAVGFGIATPDQARAVAMLADGVIIGSALIDLIAKSADAETACLAVGELLRGAAEAIAGAH